MDDNLQFYFFLSSGRWDVRAYASVHGATETAVEHPECVPYTYCHRWCQRTESHACTVATADTVSQYFRRAGTHYSKTTEYQSKRGEYYVFAVSHNTNL